ncbi:MAG: hypothetical protein II272_09415 [Oscillospiraceae bacterium]|nr:hypothetical protein [Oscillospiraceae bacterium]
MSKYESSIKCKYCSHFEPGENRCHLYHSFDQSLDKRGGASLKGTSPDSRCSHFFLTAKDTIVKSCGGRRPDGSLIVSLDDDPDLKKKLLKEEEEAKRPERISTMFTCAIAAFVLSFILTKIAGIFLELLEPIFPNIMVLPKVFIAIMVIFCGAVGYKSV